MKDSPLMDFVEDSSRGHLCFKFRDGKHTMELVAKSGLLILSYESEEEKNILYPLLESVLVTSDGGPLEIRPLHTSVYRIPYPLPRGFTVSFCPDWTHYIGIHANEWRIAALVAGLTPLLFLGSVIAHNELATRNPTSDH